jgi:hypothetical protein
LPEYGLPIDEKEVDMMDMMDTSHTKHVMLLDKGYSLLQSIPLHKEY